MTAALIQFVRPRTRGSPVA